VEYNSTTQIITAEDKPLIGYYISPIHAFTRGAIARKILVIYRIAERYIDLSGIEESARSIQIGDMLVGMSKSVCQICYALSPTGMFSQPHSEA
jgi:hypothetical protein